jgi:hypothetical protein
MNFMQDDQVRKRVSQTDALNFNRLANTNQNSIKSVELCVNCNKSMRSPF